MTALETEQHSCLFLFFGASGDLEDLVYLSKCQCCRNPIFPHSDLQVRSFSSCINLNPRITIPSDDPLPFHVFKPCTVHFARPFETSASRESGLSVMNITEVDQATVAERVWKPLPVFICFLHF